MYILLAVTRIIWLLNGGGTDFVNGNNTAVPVHVKQTLKGRGGRCTALPFIFTLVPEADGW